MQIPVGNNNRKHQGTNPLIPLAAVSKHGRICFTPRCLVSLSGINEYMARDSDRYIM